MACNYEEVIKGINYIWNNKFEEAEELFKTQKDRNPRYALHYAEAIFLRSFITADIEDTQAAMSRLKTAKELAETHIRALEKGMDPNDSTRKIEDKAELINRLLDSRVVFGESLYSTAILQMTRDAKIKGAFNLRKSWKIFEKALKESKNPAVKDVIDIEITRSLQFGAGFFLFAISIIPAKFLKFVELAGFKSDRDAGLFYIRECHKNGGVRGPYSTMTLLFNNLLLPRGLADASQYLAEADALIQESLIKYPTGSLFQVMGSHCARKQCNIEKGIELMQLALSNSSHLKSPPLIYRYELGNCYTMKLDWRNAIELYLPLIEEQRFQVRILCCLQLAAAYIMLEQRDKATAVFNKMLAIPGKKANFDPVVIRQAKRYMANGGNFAAFELLYLRRDLAKMTPILDVVLRSLDEMASKTKALEPFSPPSNRNTPTQTKNHPSPKLSFGGFKAMASSAINAVAKKKEPTDMANDDRASYLLLKGTMLKALNRQEEAIECFKEMLAMSDHISEKLYTPYCLYELGEVYFTRGQIKEAEEMMHKCSKISGYDWEDPLKIRLRVTMDQLKKNKLPKSEQNTVISIDAMLGSGTGNDDDDKDEPEPTSDDEEKLKSDEESD